MHSPAGIHCDTFPPFVVILQRYPIKSTVMTFANSVDDIILNTLHTTEIVLLIIFL